MRPEDPKADRGGFNEWGWGEPQIHTLECEECGEGYTWNGQGYGPRPMYCGRACKQRAYRRRKKAEAANG